MTDKPMILYSFRRCPYAMRARLALAFYDLTYEHREVDLKHKPEAMLAVSPKGTVPVLCLADGTVIDESLDILIWLQTHHTSNQLQPVNKLQSNRWISELHNDYIPALNRFKYPDRYQDLLPMNHYTDILENWLKALNTALASQPNIIGADKNSLALAIYPFIRQTRIANADWLSSLGLEALTEWLAQWDQSLLSLDIMHKHPVWQP